MGRGRVVSFGLGSDLNLKAEIRTQHASFPNEHLPHSLDCRGMLQLLVPNNSCIFSCTVVQLQTRGWRIIISSLLLSCSKNSWEVGGLV